MEGAEQSGCRHRQTRSETRGARGWRRRPSIRRSLPRSRVDDPAMGSDGEDHTRTVQPRDPDRPEQVPPRRPAAGGSRRTNDAPREGARGEPGRRRWRRPRDALADRARAVGRAGRAAEVGMSDIEYEEIRDSFRDRGRSTGGSLDYVRVNHYARHIRCPVGDFAYALH